MTRIDLRAVVAGARREYREASETADSSGETTDFGISKLAVSSRSVFHSSSYESSPVEEVPTALLTAIPANFANTALDAAKAWLVQFIGRDLVPAAVVRREARQAGIDAQALAEAIDESCARVRGASKGKGPNARPSQYLKIAETLTMQRDRDAAWRAYLADVRAQDAAAAGGPVMRMSKPLPKPSKDQSSFGSITLESKPSKDWLNLEQVMRSTSP